MKIIAHRGFWVDREDQNSLDAFKKALDMGFGIEIDVRDYKGQICVSHDPISEEFFPTLEKVLDLFSGYNLKLALNIKSDGIVNAIIPMVEKLDRQNYFFFDMSIPETIKYLNHKLPVFMRISEYENYSTLHSNSDGLWLDSFVNDWWIGSENIFQSEIDYCIVSPELHGRDKTKTWNFFSISELH
jgi:glycerophosphoryl diester phosphodiesterase